MRKKPIWQEVFEAGEAKGYSVTQTRQYDSDKKVPNLESYMATPFVTKDGQKVTGYAVTELSHGQGLRSSNTVEFFVNGHNLDYSGETLYDKAGQKVDMQAARTEMGDFASAASEYPHVMTYPEWQEAMKANYARLRLDGEPGEPEYETYLQREEQKLLKRNYRYVGEVQSARELSRMYQTVPSFEQFMDDVSQEMDTQEFE